MKVEGLTAICPSCGSIDVHPHSPSGHQLACAHCQYWGPRSNFSVYTGLRRAEMAKSKPPTENGRVKPIIEEEDY